MRVVEVSFEVGNRVGGIHTVLKTKANLMRKLFPDYLTIGFYDDNKSPIEFEEMTPPPALQEVFDSLNGMEIHYGKWLVPGTPETILIKPTDIWRDLNTIKYYYWEWFGVDSLRSDDWFNTPVVWGYSVGKLLEALSRMTHLCVIFHEWLSGSALLYVRKFVPSVPTLFHTHATILGRTIANAGLDLYSIVDSRRENPDKMAYDMHIEAKHLMEKASAHNAHVFTTVSEPTARECEYILGKSPDYVLPNGLDMSKVPPIEESAVKHTENEVILRDFVRAYFFPYHSFDLDKTLFFFFSGRYDLRAKGIDVLIKALGLLNKRLKKENLNRWLVFFFWVAGPVFPPNLEVLENLSAYRALTSYIDRMLPSMRDRLIDDLLESRHPSVSLPDDALFDIRKIMYGFRRKKQNAPLSTHLPADWDIVPRWLREAGLLNAPDDRVKVVYYPSYLSPADGFLNLPYIEAVTGTHLGVFPSYYEPWGYTPLETAAYGVPAVTTDVSGFGQFIKSSSAGSLDDGIIVLRRRGISDDSFAHTLSDTLYTILTMPRRRRLEMKIRAKHLAKAADWARLIHAYKKAIDTAINRAG